MSKSNRVLLLLSCVVCLALAFALVGCSGATTPNSGGTVNGETGNPGTTGGDTSASGPQIVEQGLAFEPATLEIAVGETVTFINKDSSPHNVRIDGQELGQQAQGETKVWTADKAGTYPYSCTIHPSMTGEIVVK